MIKEFYNIWIILFLFTGFIITRNVNESLNIDQQLYHEVLSYPDVNSSKETLSNCYNSDYKELNKALGSKILNNANSLSILSNGGPVVATVNPSFAAICSSEELQLTASGGDNYLWVPNPGNPSGGSLSDLNIPNPIFSNGFPGSFYVYDVVVSDNNIPPNKDTARVIISIYNNPVISITPFPGVVICENEEVVLTAIGGVSYLWENAITGDSLGVGDTLQVSPSSMLFCRVIGTDANSCSESNQVAIFVEEINEFANASAPGLCEGDSVLLTGGTGDQLTWMENGSPIGFGNSIYVTPTETTTYDLYIQNTSGCQDSAQVTVEYYETPMVINPVDDFSNCDGDTIALAIQINQPIQSYSITGSGNYENDDIQGNILIFDAIYVSDTSMFSVTLFGNNACSVIESFEILPCDCGGPTISSISIEEAKCNGKDGSATINIENPEAYFYTWTPNLGLIQGAGNERTALPFGVYNVEIIDTLDLNCSSFIDVLITNANGPEASVNANSATCSLSDGSANLSPLNYDYLWEDSVLSNSRNDLSSGTYFVTVTDPLYPDCSDIISVEIIEDNLLIADLTIENMPTCSMNNGSISIQVLNGSDDYTFAWKDGFVTSDSIRTALSSGSYEVTIIDNGPSGCELPIQFVLTDSLESVEIDLIGAIGTTCNGMSDGRIDYTVNFDTSFIAGADTLITDGFLVYENGQLSEGEYCLFILDGNDCIAGELCFYIEEPDAIEILFEIEPDCGFGGEIDLTSSGGTAPYTYDWGDIPGTSNAEDRTELPAGDYLVTVSDSNGCEMINQFVTVPVCSNDCNFFGGIDTLNMELENCLSIGEYCFPVLINDLQNCQIMFDGVMYTEALTSCDNDTFLNGYLLQFEPGVHEVIVIDTLFDCYNILVANISCSNVDTVCINETKEFCVSAEDLDLIGEIASMTNLCSDTIDNNVVFELDLENLCVSYEGKNMGEDSVCIEVCDLLGNCGTFSLRVIVDNCLLSTPDFFKDTIYITETSIFCPDTSELAGNIVSINNFCLDQSGDFVDFFSDQNTFCVEYSGLEIGVDSACIEICDDLGFCDTTFMCVVVEEVLVPPIAVDNCDTTNMGAPVVINVLANDTVFGRVTSTEIITDPMWGTATVNLDNSITYNASEEFCERIDSFHYEVCTDAGCDTASVCVWIACVDIFVFTAISPNRDGVNDVFYIAGIEDYPESVLQIFNRWGNLVFEKANYKNTWRGTYDGNTDLPDGTYYYLLELNDENNRVFKGYLELFR